MGMRLTQMAVIMEAISPRIRRIQAIILLLEELHKMQLLQTQALEMAHPIHHFAVEVQSDQ